MRKKPLYLAWLILIIGLALILLFVFDKVNTSIGICGMALCTLAVATRIGWLKQKKNHGD